MDEGQRTGKDGYFWPFLWDQKNQFVPKRSWKSHEEGFKEIRTSWQGVNIQSLNDGAEEDRAHYVVNQFCIKI